MGKYRISEEFENLEECKENLQTITWERIIQVLEVIRLNAKSIDNIEVNE